MFTTDQKGAIAETAIAHAAVRLGAGVARPETDERYDLIFDLRPGLLRVQCKWATRHGDVVIVRCASCRRARTGMVTRRYTTDEVDAVVAYCMELDSMYWITPLFFDRRVLQLRLGPTLNRQERRINWAADFDFEATLQRLLGAVAQLGER